MAIDQVDRTVVTQEPVVVPGQAAFVDVASGRLTTKIHDTVVDRLVDRVAVRAASCAEVLERVS